MSDTARKQIRAMKDKAAEMIATQGTEIDKLDRILTAHEKEGDTRPDLRRVLDSLRETHRLAKSVVETERPEDAE
jgi:uncharacterized protein (DUF305 family)